MAEAREIEEPAKTASQLREEIIRLGPWYLDVEVASGLTTRASIEAARRYPSALGYVPFKEHREEFVETVRRLYPNGLEGRSVLDCACNCGAYLFWAKELGAGKCFGFDAREHWIRQACFLAEHREGPGEDIEFRICELYELPKLGLEPFDIVLFNGIFYHLPDPTLGLKTASELTGELMVVNSATKSGLPDGALWASEESASAVMSGIYGLHWLPTGPGVMSGVLEWLGFPETRCNYWRRNAGQRPARRDRLELLAARNGDLFEAYDADDAAYPKFKQAVRQNVPEGATVLVVSRGDDRLLALGPRCGWHFPQGAGGGWAGFYPADSAGAIGRVETLRGEGAHYIAFPEAALWWLDHYGDFGRYLENRFDVVLRDDICVLVSLNNADDAASTPEEGTQ